MERSAIPFRKMVFVCVNRRDNGEACCADRGSEAVLQALKDRVKAMGLAGMIRVSKSGCHDVCARGPSVMVFPDDIWYHGVTSDDVERIVSDLTRELTTTQHTCTASSSRNSSLSAKSSLWGDSGTLPSAHS